METDVAQLVIRTEIEEGYRYFLARRTRDSYWEWIGGKREEDETIEETAERELREEIQIDWESHGFEIQGVADSYPSEADSSYLLNPVLIEVEEQTFRAISEEHLSNEHDSFEWIKLTDFGEFDTLGQYKALERLDLIEGDVALAVVLNKEEFLIVERSEENTSSGEWGFVSGKMEEDEKPPETAKRELWEETRLKAEPLETGDFYIGKGELGYWRLFPVLMETGSREVELNWELSDYRWISLEEINELKSIGRLKALEKLSIDYE
jgi:8-oxo-dGTP pyrophosphatase MutT (NUDIX family)